MVPPDAQADVFYVLKQGEILGPFSGDELKAAVETGRFSFRDLVQREGQPIWQPLGRILETSGDDSFGAIAPDWRSILTWAWVRIRYDLGEQSLGAGALCLGVGTLALALSRWPMVFWVPWFGAAIVASIILLRRQRAEHGLLLLVGIVCIPLASIALRPKAAVQSDRAVIEETNNAVEPSAPTAIPATVAVVRETSPKPVVEPLPIIPALETPSLPSPASPRVTVLETPGQPAPLPPAPPQTTPEQANAAQPEGPGFVQRTVDLLSKFTSKSDEQAPSKLPAKPVEQPTNSATAANPESEKPSSGSETAAPGDLVQSHTNAFVLIKGRDSSGSGFICRVGSQAFLFTNIHVIAGMQQPQFTTLDGASVALGAADAAAGHDIMRFALPKSPTQPLEAMTDIANNVRIDDEVAVLGNSGGGGVVTSIKGKVVGIGPDRIEVSAEFIPGNSGSPIIHVKTGKVIGVATYLTKRYEEFANGSSPSTPPDNNPPPQSTPPPRPGFAPPRNPTPPPSPRGSESGSVVVRRFAYRIDSVRVWEPVNWAIFRQESEQIHQISRLTEDVIGFLGAIRNRQQPSFLTDTLRRPANQWLTSISNQRLSAADRLRATEGFLRTLRSMVRADVSAAEASLRYSYFRDDLRNEREARDRLYEAFDAQAKRMASPSERFTR